MTGEGLTAAKGLFKTWLGTPANAKGGCPLINMGVMGVELVWTTVVLGVGIEALLSLIKGLDNDGSPEVKGLLCVGAALAIVVDVSDGRGFSGGAG